MSCFAQRGASYHESPMRRSGLPSLLTSATATPSERNFPSTTVFFHDSGSAAEAVGVTRARQSAVAARAAGVAVRAVMGGEPSGLGRPSEHGAGGRTEGNPATGATPRVGVLEKKSGFAERSARP